MAVMIRWSRGTGMTDSQTADPQPNDGQTPGSESDDEALVDLLSDPHCRYLLRYLRENASPVSIDEVTRYVVAELTDTTPEDVPEDVRRRVQTWFHHGQLPTLDDHGIVEFDPESGTVTLVTDPSVPP